MSFELLYDLHELVGKGAFSSVYRCVHRLSQETFAVKVSIRPLIIRCYTLARVACLTAYFQIIDLRPLKLRPNFDTKRLMREVDIMKSIKHENIVELIEV